MFLTLNHQRLEIYNFSKSFVKESYKLTQLLPPEERFGMISQIRRAALSVHLNIAEGSSRKSETERKRYYEISRGSIIEIDAAIDIANELGYFNNYDLNKFGDAMVTCFKLLSRLISPKAAHCPLTIHNSQFTTMYEKSKTLFERAQKSIPGGVNSPVRAFKSVGGTPVFMNKAKGTYLYDADGNKYIDYIASWGPMILGHAYEPVVKAIQEKALDSTSFGAPTQLEIEMAELIISMVPNVDMIRMVSSGTEACMSALRLARGYTGKNKFIKFEGNYHGHADAFLVKAGSGLATFDIQTVPGVTGGVSNDTLTAPYNDIDAVKKLVAENKNEIAAIFVEPVAGNMGCILPAPGFLEALRTICDDEHIVLVFDEVMTGFRLAAGGAQEKLGIRADLVTYGKVIGGGMPVGAFGGKKEIMQHIAPVGNVYQAGTLSGNPIAMIAGYTILSELKNNPFIYTELEAKTVYLKNGLDEVLHQWGKPYTINQFGSMISIHFSDHPVTDFATAASANNELFKQYFHAMLKRGVYLPPSAFESWFLNNALTYNDLDETIVKTRESLQEIG